MKSLQKAGNTNEAQMSVTTARYEYLQSVFCAFQCGHLKSRQMSLYGCSMFRLRFAGCEPGINVRRYSGLDTREAKRDDFYLQPDLGLACQAGIDWDFS